MPTLTLALTLLLAAPWCAADGGYLMYDGAEERLSQVRQEVLIAVHGPAYGDQLRVTYVVRSQYTGPPQEFAWIMPLPGIPTDVVAHEDDALFERLDARTAPLLFGPGESYGLLGGCACSVPVAEQSYQPTVTVEAEGTAGVFEWAAVTTDSGAAALLDWLSAYGYAVPDSALPVIEGYVDRHFLAVRLGDAQGSSDQAVRTLPPIQFTVATGERYYPMAISRISGAPETEVLLYLWADSEQTTADRSSVRLDRSQLEFGPLWENGVNYEQLIRTAIAEHGPGTMIVEYSQPFWWSDVATSGALWPAAPQDVTGTGWLTRFRTVLAADEMTFDYTFVDAVWSEPLARTVDRAAAPGGTADALVALTPVLLVGGWRIRRRFRMAVPRRARP